MRKILTFVLLVVFGFVNAFSQNDGGRFAFLDLPFSARMSAFGGTNVALQDDDLNFSLNNPSLLSEKTHNQLAFNYSNFFNDLNLGSVLYGRNFGERNFTAFGAHYLDYGKFLGTTETDEILGNFTAKELMLSASYARVLHPCWTIGLSFKPLFSFFERYQHYGFGVDVGANYADKEHDFYAGLAFRNVGMSIAGYRSATGNEVRMLPWNVEFSLVKGFKHAPIRISMTAHNLQRWNLNFRDEAALPEDFVPPTRASEFFDMLFRHTIFNLEILPTKNLYLLVSYNHRRLREMRVSDYKTAAGFAFGAGLKVYRFHIDLGFAQYQAGQFSFNASFTTYLSDFGVK